jgi:hypothetical protein
MLRREGEAMMGEAQEKVLNLRSVFGLGATVTTASAATDGAYVEMDIVLQPRGHTDPYDHPEQEETFKVSRRHAGGLP